MAGQRRDRDSYEETRDRLPRFWDAYPCGRIATRFVVLDDVRGAFICRARLYRDVGDRVAFAEGWCEEHTDPEHMINRAYALENCETGAIGRALANGNFASQDHARPTGSEMGKAERQGGGPRPATPRMRADLERLVDERGLPDGCPWPIPVDASMVDVANWTEEARKRPPETEKPLRVPSVRDTPPEVPTPPTTPEDAPPSFASRPWGRPFPFDAPPSRVAAYWSIAYAAVPGVGHVSFLKRAQAIADELGQPIPARSGDVSDPELVDACQKWLEVTAGRHVGGPS